MQKYLPLFTANEVYAQTTYKNTVTIDSLTLISNHDFDATHPAGTNLIDVFSTQDTSAFFLQPWGISHFYLLQNPSDTGTHTFTIKLFKSDSTKNMIATSLPVKLLL